MLRIGDELESSMGAVGAQPGAAGACVSVLVGGILTSHLVSLTTETHINDHSSSQHIFLCASTNHAAHVSF